MYPHGTTDIISASPSSFRRINVPHPAGVSERWGTRLFAAILERIRAIRCAATIVTERYTIAIARIVAD